MPYCRSHVAMHIRQFAIALNDRFVSDTSRVFDSFFATFTVHRDVRSHSRASTRARRRETRAGPDAALNAAPGRGAGRRGAAQRPCELASRRRERHATIHHGGSGWVLAPKALD